MVLTLVCYRPRSGNGPEERKKTPEITHPLVRRHPDTGRETLFIQPRIIGSVVGIDGMSDDESTALIEELISHITSEPFVYRHRWNPLDVVVWDNRCVLHSATTKDLPEKYVRRTPSLDHTRPAGDTVPSGRWPQQAVGRAMSRP